ncbi:family 20 glycosylhydrolase [soil metagenome]
MDVGFGFMGGRFMGIMNSTRRQAKTLAAAAFVMLGSGSFACSGPPAMHADETGATEPVEAPQPAGEPAEVAIVPAPMSLGRNGGTFTLSSATEIHVGTGDPDVARIAGQLAELLSPGTTRGIRRLTETARLPASGIALLLDASLDSLAEEGYRLAITSQRVVASAPRPAGLFYALQTLRQLLPPEHVERGAPLPAQAVHAVTIVDRPRYAWRGAMLDVSRHFLGPADVKRYIDLMALYKLNRLHLHLSDDQGWRIEIKSWPNLTARGGSTAVGGGPGGFYTQAEYSDLVEYARERFITIVPEIDMPGHTNAALASYAELNCDGRARPLYTGIRVGFSALCPSKEITYRFVDDVVREISALTPGPWFHIGGDEVKTLSAAQYAAFIERVQAIVQSHGKQMIGWGEIEGATLLPTTIVQHWQPTATARAAIRQRSRFILSPANKVYLDMKYDPSTTLGLRWAGYVDVRTSYDWDPATLVAGIGESSIVGIEAPLWSETVVTIADYEYMAFPRLAAVAEVAWSQHARRDWTGFSLRLAAHGPRWQALGVNYYRSRQIPWP